MSLTIEYGSSGSSLRPGSVLDGIVRFVSDKDEAIATVTLVFSGRCKVKIREHLHYTTRSFRSRGYYFYKEIQLFEGGNFTHKAGEYAWPFSFYIPEYAEQDVQAPATGRPKRQLDHTGIMKVIDAGTSQDFFPINPPWRASNELRPHPLPDTFMATLSKWPIDLNARVEYTLIAKLERPNRGSFLFRAKDIETLVDVNIKAGIDKSSITLLSKMRTEQVEKVIALGPSKSVSIGGSGWTQMVPGKARQTNQSESLRMLFSVHYPAAVCARSMMPFIVKAEATAEAGHTNPINGMKASVTDLTISLLCVTAARDDSQAATEHTAYKREKETLCWRREHSNSDIAIRLDAQNQKVKGEINLEDLVRTPALVPSFSTYNIARTYYLEYELKVKVRGGEHVAAVILKADSLPVRVLPFGADAAMGKGSEQVDAAPSQPHPEDRGRLESVYGKDAEAATEREAGTRSQSEHDDLPAYEP